MAQPVRILLVDDHLTIMVGCEQLLNESRIKTVAKIVDPDKAVEAYKETKPDVVVLDIRFGPDKQTGIDIAKQLIKADSSARIVIFSQFDQAEIVQECFKAGVHAFLTKGCNPPELEKAVRKAAAGERYIGEQVSQQVIAYMANPPINIRDLLDDQELEIIRMVSAGDNLVNIGAKFGHSNKWAHTAVRKIKEKLGVTETADLIRLAVKNDLLRSSI